MEALAGLIGLFIVLAVIAGIIGLIVALAARNRAKARTISADWQPPKSDPLPYDARPNLFTGTERAFYEQLKSIVDPSQTIFAKVRIADLLKVRSGSSSWQSHFNKISCKHADFVICNEKLVPALVIELDDSSHDRDDRKERDAFVDQAFAATKLPLVHVRAQRSYNPEELKAVLMPYVKLTSSAAVKPVSVPTTHPDAKYMGSSTPQLQNAI